jgi:two-component system, NarL family, sensor histidine kinase DegS
MTMDNNAAVNLQSSPKIKTFQNPHFWAIALIVSFLLIFYYQSYIFGYRVFSYFWYLELYEFNYNIIGSLFFIPLIYTAVVFRWRGAVIMWLISMVIILPQILTFRTDLASHITNIFFLLIPLIIVVFISLELSWRDRERKALSAREFERESERQNYLSQIFKAQEDERKRISQEIHDDPIQKLAGVASLAQMLARDKSLENSPALKERSESIRDTIISISHDLRRLSVDLRPTVLDDLGLIPALYWLVDRFKQESGIAAQMEIIGESRELTKKITVLIFRIVQEALNNARKHSQAKNVRVTLQFRDKTIKAVVQDDGKGFSVQDVFKHYELLDRGKLGLIGMHQRTQVLNGTFAIKSEPGKGTLISVEVFSK